MKFLVSIDQKDSSVKTAAFEFVGDILGANFSKD